MSFGPSVSLRYALCPDGTLWSVVDVGSGIHPAINGEIRAGNVRGLLTGDESHQRGDLINAPIAVERCGGLLRHRPLARRGIQIRVDRTWLDVIDRDTPARDFSGQPLTEHLHRALRGRVGYQPGHEDTFAHRRADHDDATARLHVLERCLRRDERPATLMSITRSISSSVVSSKVFGMAVPALFTSTSSRPKVATVFSTAPLTDSTSAASAWIATAVPPRSSIALTTAEAALASFAYVMATLAPSAARRFAIAAPMPLEPPVMSATFSFNLDMGSPCCL